jgi:hypothetical protein
MTAEGTVGALPCFYQPDIPLLIQVLSEFLAYVTSGSAPDEKHFAGKIYFFCPPVQLETKDVDLGTHSIW